MEQTNSSNATASDSSRNFFPSYNLISQDFAGPRIHVPPTEGNWAFIDMQNVNRGVQQNGWEISWLRFRQYLRDALHATKAVAFMGYIKEYQRIYARLRRAGFILEFRPVKRLKDGTIDGGNIDADLTSYVMDYKRDYHQAIIIADDADYFRTIKSLNRQDKLKLVISSHQLESTSRLIRQAVRNDQLISIHSLRHQIQ